MLIAIIIVIIIEISNRIHYLKIQDKYKVYKQ